MSELWPHILADFSDLTAPAQLAAFVQVLMIDVMLAGDNAVVIGTLAAGLAADRRRKVILIGICAALVLRIAFALVVTQLLGIVGLVFAGGVLLLWVAWKMGRDLWRPADHAATGLRPVRGFAAAVWAVAVADVSMSLDNVLAVAGAAREHPGILVIGLLLSVMLMGLAANLIARIIERHRWIAWIGLAVIVYVAGRMIHDGLASEKTGLLTLFR